MSRILVIGSSNTDMVIKTEKLPAPGETILGGIFLMNPGGKGANQAVAAARLGGKVTFITKRGNDLFGNQAVGLLMREGIDTQYIVKDNELPSGVALITVDSAGKTVSWLPRDQMATCFLKIFHRQFLRLVILKFSCFNWRYQ